MKITRAVKHCLFIDMMGADDKRFEDVEYVARQLHKQFKYPAWEINIVKADYNPHIYIDSMDKDLVVAIEAELFYRFILAKVKPSLFSKKINC